MHNINTNKPGFSFKPSRILVALSSILFSLSTPISVANETEERVEKITVVGSNISRAELEGPAPVTLINAEDIIKSGAPDLVSLLQKLPSAGQGTFSTQGNSSDDTANGGSGFSLRGLGADSTLVLLNGRRIAISPFAKNIDTSFVDLNTIPLAAIERVEILQDGASAIYGSDAIAGVVNIVLKSSMEGVSISAKTGFTADGGGSEKALSLVWGNATGDSGYTAVLDYFTREETLYGDRHYSRSANQAALNPNDPDAVNFSSSSGVPGTIQLDSATFIAQNGLAAFNALSPEARLRYADTYGDYVCAPENISVGSSGSTCTYDYAPHSSSNPATERVSLMLSSFKDFTDTLSGFADFSAQYNSSIVKGAASPSFNELFMAADSPNHPFLNNPTHPLFNQPLTMRRRLTEIGNRKKDTETLTGRLVLGLDWQMSDNWSSQAYINTVTMKGKERGIDGFPNILRVQESIDNGSFNPFEPQNASQETLDYMETQTTRNSRSHMRSVQASATGPLFSLTHGEVMSAFGAEYRKESISDVPDIQFLNGEIFGTEATQAEAERDNKALFAELSIPVLQDLELQAALRYERYSDFGSTINPKLSAKWTFEDKAFIRSSWGTAFRAPSLHQIGLGRTDESPNLVDTQRCRQTDDPEDCDPREYTVIFSGNPDLDPEESDSFNLGMGWDITPSLSIAADYWFYNIDNLIKSDSQTTLNTFGSDPSRVIREPSSDGSLGSIIEIIDSYQNVSGVLTDGIDATMNYKTALHGGDLNVDWSVSYLHRYDEDGRARKGQFEHPSWQWRANSDWSKGNATYGAAINFTGKFADDDEQGFGDKEVDAMTTFDVFGTYRFNNGMTTTLGALNLFNEEPPYSYNDYMGYVEGTHSAQGRFVYLSFRYDI